MEHDDDTGSCIVTVKNYIFACPQAHCFNVHLLTEVLSPKQHCHNIINICTIAAHPQVSLMKQLCPQQTNKHFTNNALNTLVQQLPTPQLSFMKQLCPSKHALGLHADQHTSTKAWHPAYELHFFFFFFFFFMGAVAVQPAVSHAFFTGIFSAGKRVRTLEPRQSLCKILIMTIMEQRPSAIPPQPYKHVESIYSNYTNVCQPVYYAVLFW